MEIRTLSDRDLLTQTKQLAAQERELLTRVLQHLREVDRRRLFADLKFKSLYDYAIKELGYSEDQAYRRITAMRLLQELPQVEQKLNEGVLSLSSLSVAANLFRAEARNCSPMSRRTKLNVLDAIARKSRREAEVIVQNFTTLPKEALRPPRTRVFESGTEETVFFSHGLSAKLARVKGLLAHSNPNLSTAELLEKFCDEFLRRFGRKMRGNPAGTEEVEKNGNHDRSEVPGNRDRGGAASNEVCLPSSESMANVDSMSSGNSQPLRNGKPAAPSERVTSWGNPRSSRTGKISAPPRNPASSAEESGKKTFAGRRPAISMELKRRIWRRDRGCCTLCGSHHAVEIDHIIPVANGGAHCLENLRLLCRSCNQRAAIVKLGLTKMAPFLDRKGPQD